MTCADTPQRIDAWIAGTLTEADARAVEQHAAGCVTCYALLDAASSFDTLPQRVEPPIALRAMIVAAVARRRALVRRRRLAVGVTGIAAIALLAIMSRPATKSASDFPGAIKSLEAMEHARPSFATLAAAERDIEAALRQQPGDQVLSDALVRIRRQHEALSRMVREAGS